MSELEVTLPSGVQGTIRGLKIKQLNLFSDRKMLRTGEFLEKFLEWGWVRTTSTGTTPTQDGGASVAPYPWLQVGDGGMDWQRALQADRFYAMVMVRAATDGALFDFSIPCSHCGKPIESRVHLVEDLVVKRIPGTSLELHRAGKEFERVIAGTPVKFRLLTGADERDIQKRMEADTDKITTGISARLTWVDGITDKKKIRAWVDDLDAGIITDLRQMFEEVDGGVETAVAVTCDQCGRAQETELPLGGTDFWKALRRQKPTISA